MTADTRVRQRDRPFDRGAWRTLSLGLAIALALYLVTVHAQHFFDERSDGTDLHTAHVVPAPVPHIASLTIAAARDGMHCVMPNMLAPQVETLELIAPLVIWFAPVLLLAAAFQRSVGTGWDRPRPPGPTRQAILHCFRL